MRKLGHCKQNFVPTDIQATHFLFLAEGNHNPGFAFSSFLFHFIMVALYSTEMSLNIPTW